MSVGDGVQSSSYVYPFPVYVLYNAYHPKDDAYCPEALLRTGYLETERTVYFQGEVTAVRRFAPLHGPRHQHRTRLLSPVEVTPPALMQFQV